MSTAEQIDANRRNSENSTGPVTPEGKDTSRFNALKHGLRAASLILPNEIQADFDHLVSELNNAFAPQDFSDVLLIEKLAIAEWKLARLERTERAIRLADPDGLEKFDLLDRLYTQQARLERSSDRARRALDRTRQARREESQKVHDEELESLAEREPRIIPGLHYNDKKGWEETRVYPMLKYPGQEPVRWDKLDPATRKHFFPDYVPKFPNGVTRDCL